MLKNDLFVWKVLNSLYKNNFVGKKMTTKDQGKVLMRELTLGITLDEWKEIKILSISKFSDLLIV